MDPIRFTYLGTAALRTIGAVGQGVPVGDYDIQVAYDVCQEMIDGWAAQRLTIFQTIRRLFDLVAGQGTPANPYTIGVGGDFDVPRPTWIPNANLVVTTNPPTPYEYPLDILTPDQYARIAIKTLSSAMATALYFDGKFDTTGADVGLGDIFLYPVPNGQQTVQLAMYIPIAMTGFADIGTTEYQFPPGYVQALRYQLAKRLATEYGKEWSAANESLAVEGMRVIESANVPIPTLRSDYGLPGMGAATSLYNWRTGTNSRRGNW